MKVITNNHQRPIIYFWELPENIQKEYMLRDYSVAEDQAYFCYRNNYYSFSEFLTTNKTGWTNYPELKAIGWHGVLADGNVVLKICNNLDYVIIGRIVL